MWKHCLAAEALWGFTPACICQNVAWEWLDGHFIKSCLYLTAFPLLLVNLSCPSCLWGGVCGKPFTSLAECDAVGKHASILQQGSPLSAPALTQVIYRWKPHSLHKRLWGTFFWEAVSKSVTHIPITFHFFGFWAPLNLPSFIPATRARIWRNFFFFFFLFHKYIYCQGICQEKKKKKTLKSLYSVYLKILSI